MSLLHPHYRHQPQFSAKKTVKPVNFLCMVTEAQQVSVIGDFNDWHPNAHPMERQIDGCWRAEITLPPGYHHYQFLIDGKPTLDPRASGIARNEQNEKVSLIAVS